MGVLIRNTETGYEVTLDINVAKEIAAQMKAKVLDNAIMVAATKVLLPEVAKFATGVFLGQCGFLSVCLSEPFESAELAETFKVLTDGKEKFLANGDVQGPYEVPEVLNGGKSAVLFKPPVQAPTQGCDTLSAEEFLKMWEPPAKEKN